MFYRASFCYAEIFHGTEKIDIWDYLDHTQVIVDKDLVNALLTYLRTHHKKYPMTGSVRFHTGNGILEYQVRNAWLI